MRTSIPDEEFMPAAVNLKAGQSVRIDHSCMGASSGTLMVTREAGKVTAYCFRCGGKGYHAEQEKQEDRIARLQAERRADDTARAALSLPEPRVYALDEWPRTALLWLYRAGFSPDMIDKLGAYWCPAMGRVVLPVMSDGHAIFWQARAIGRTPKIISPSMPRAGVVGRYGKGNTLVLCEDTLSAFKVGRETEAWSLLGTKLLPGVAAEIVRSNRPVIVWLDSDAPGQIAARDICRQLRAFGVDVRNVVTPRDPKLYHRQFIKEKVSA